MLRYRRRTDRESLIERAGPIRQLLADKTHDANHLRHLLAKRRIKAVIPSTASRSRAIAYDTTAYKERNRIAHTRLPWGDGRIDHCPATHVRWQALGAVPRRKLSDW